jgi:Flp pilus assembly protein TadB
LSGRVVAALPLIFLALSALVSKSTLGVLIGSTPGLIILVVALCLNAAGFLWIRKILDIEE